MRGQQRTDPTPVYPMQYFLNCGQGQGRHLPFTRNKGDALDCLRKVPDTLVRRVHFAEIACVRWPWRSSCGDSILTNSTHKGTINHGTRNCSNCAPTEDHSSSHLMKKKDQMKWRICREYTLLRSEEASRVRGWILGNTKIGPVSDVKVCL